MVAKTLNTLNHTRKSPENRGFRWLRVCILTLNQSINQTLNRVIVWQKGCIDLWVVGCFVACNRLMRYASPQFAC